MHHLRYLILIHRLRKYLQKATTPIAHLIGQIYFNVIGPQCFKFKQETVCVQRYWWGACKTWESSKVAHPKRQRRFKSRDRDWFYSKNNKHKNNKYSKNEVLSPNVI